jgi:hypothetical protein
VRIRRFDLILFFFFTNGPACINVFATVWTVYRRVLSSKPGSKQSSASYLFHGGFLLGLFFEPEDGGDMFLRNVYIVCVFLCHFPLTSNLAFSYANYFESSTNFQLYAWIILLHIVVYRASSLSSPLLLYGLGILKYFSASKLSF